MAARHRTVQPTIEQATLESMELIPETAPAAMITVGWSPHAIAIHSMAHRLVRICQSSQRKICNIDLAMCPFGYADDITMQVGANAKRWTPPNLHKQELGTRASCELALCGTKLGPRPPSAPYCTNAFPAKQGAEEHHQHSYFQARTAETNWGTKEVVPKLEIIRLDPGSIGGTNAVQVVVHLQAFPGATRHWEKAIGVPKLITLRGRIGPPPWPSSPWSAQGRPTVSQPFPLPLVDNRGHDLVQ